MNDGKFKISIIDEEIGTQVVLPDKLKFALVKISNEEPIPDDEPIFIFRCRDAYALDALIYYRELSIKNGCTDYHQDGMNAAISRFREWQINNPDKLKQPGITMGV